MAINSNNAANPVLSGIYNEKLLSNDAFLLTRPAPMRVVSGYKASYSVHKDPQLLATEMNGYDPFTPMSIQAPARELEFGFEPKTFDAERFSDKVLLTDIDAAQLSASALGDPGLVGKYTTRMATIHRQIVEKRVADLFNDPANFANTGTIDLSTSSSVVYGKLVNAIDAIRGNFGGKVAVVMNSRVAGHLAGHPDVAGSIGGGGAWASANVTRANLAQWFADTLGVELMVSSAVYTDNTTNPAAPVNLPMYANSTLAVVAVGDSQEEAVFAHTPVGSSDGITPMLSDVWTFRSEDPRGEFIAVESLFKPEVVARSLGYRFAVTLPS